MRLTEAIERFLTTFELEDGATERSVDSYRRLLDKIEEDWPESEMSDFDGRPGTERLRKTMARRWGKASAATWNNVTSVYHTFFAWAESEDLIEDDPARRIRRRRNRRPRIERPGESELSLGLSATIPLERPAWILMAGVGLRNSTVCATQWQNIDLTTGRVLVPVKGGDWEVFPIAPDALDELRTCYREIQPEQDDYVFPKQRIVWERGVPVNKQRPLREVADPKRPSSPQALWRMVKRVCKRAGIRPLYPHLLRHGHGTRLRRHGMALDEIQRLLGHADPRTTQAYVDEIEVERLAERLASVLQASPLLATVQTSLFGGAASSLMEAAGIEPASAASGGEKAAGIEPGASDDPSEPALHDVTSLIAKLEAAVAVLKKIEVRQREDSGCA